jgi:hypothetical protein
MKEQDMARISLPGESRICKSEPMLMVSHIGDGEERAMEIAKGGHALNTTAEQTCDPRLCQPAMRPDGHATRHPRHRAQTPAQTRPTANPAHC